MSHVPNVLPGRRAPAAGRVVCLLAAWLSLALLVACGGDAAKVGRPLGAVCEESGDCDEGTCLAGRCLDPEADEDRDGVINRVEDKNGTNVLSADSDNDGIRDGDELRPDLANEDADGDGKPDSLESAVADADGDCLPDQFDGDDARHDGDLSPLIDKLCSRAGVCGGTGSAALRVSCADAEAGAFCDYEDVPGYEPVETSCDALDNDCDGRTDEELPLGACEAELVALALNPRAPVLALADTLVMTLVGTYDNGSVRDVGALATWTSSDALHVAVDATGRITAVASGEATIKATIGALSAETVATVAPARVTGLTLAPLAPEGDVGDVIDLVATASYEDTSSADVSDLVTWVSAVPEVASVALDGKVSLVRPGETTVTALFGGARASVKVVVHGTSVVFTTLAIEDSGEPLAVGTQRALGLVASDGLGNAQSVASQATWTSSDSAVATVSPQGVVAAVGVGTATITAEYAGLSDTVDIMVGSAATVGLRVSPLGASVDVGQTLPLTAFVVKTDGNTTDVTGQATWTSKAPGVALVSSAGVVTGVAAGAASIEVTYGTFTATADVTVVQSTPVTQVVIVTGTSSTLAVGQTTKLTATALASNQTLSDVTTTAAWTSTAPLVASVSSQGVVTALEAGQTTIRATYQGKTGSYAMTIVAKTPVAIGLVLTPTSASIPRGQTRTFAARTVFDDGSFADASGVTWTTANAAVATVDSSGKVSAVTEGTTTVKAAAAGFEAIGIVTVTAATSSFSAIRVDPAAPVIMVGQELILKVYGMTPTGEVDASPQAIFSSGNAGIATVSQAGFAKGIAAGQTQVFVVVGPLLAEVTLEVRAKTPLPLVFASSARVYVPSLTAGLPAQMKYLVLSNETRAYIPVRHVGGLPNLMRKGGVVMSASARVFAPVRLPLYRDGKLNGVSTNEKPVGVFYANP